MYFLWKNTDYGMIRISSGGLYEFAEDSIRSKLRLYSITLTPIKKTEMKPPACWASGSEDNADLTIVLSEDDLIPEVKNKIEAHFKNVMKPLGIIASVVWASPENWIASLVRSPWTWAGFASCAAVIVTAGFEGFFWTLFWGSAAWFAVRSLRIIARKFRSA